MAGKPSRRRKATKAGTVTVAGSLIAWAVQQVLTGDPLTGGIGILVSMALLYAYVTMDMVDVPFTQAELQEGSEMLGDEAEDILEGSSVDPSDAMQDDESGTDGGGSS